jgi:hypothetical protein
MPFARAAIAAATGVALMGSGFAVHDLRVLKAQPEALLGRGYIARTDSARMTLTCPTCAGLPSVDVLIGRQDDGTEGRVRSGQTPIAQLDSMCRSRNPSCRIERVAVEPAVGWISSYALGPIAANTVVILRDGDLLTIRSIADSSIKARRNVNQLLRTIVPKIVGSANR